MTDELFAAMRRFPDVEGPNLVAVDASDRLILDEASALVAAAAPGSVVVIGDGYGALSLGLVARHGTVGLRTHQDRVTGELALAANAERAGIPAPRLLPLGPELLAGATVVLLQLPRSLDALDEIAQAVAAHADPSVVLVAGGRIKHMTPTMNEVLARWFGTVDVHHARQKSRVLTASGPRTEAALAEQRWPHLQRHDDVGLTIAAHGGVFAGTGIDIGSRFLHSFVGQIRPEVRDVVDLGCGTGLLAAAVAARHPGVAVVATDESAAAVASASATAAANGLADRIVVTRDDAGAGLPEASADLVLLNPPFHTGATVHAGIAPRLFASAARMLRPGGELWVVWNSHLMYRPTLQRVVGPTWQLGRNAKFTVTASRLAD